MVAVPPRARMANNCGRRRSLTDNRHGRPQVR